MPVRTTTALLAVLLALGPTPALSVQEPANLHASHALSFGRLLGLTPEGSSLWARHLLRTGDWQDWKRLTQVEAEIGRQLASEQSDWRLLERLADDYGAESGRAARVRRQSSVDTALQLTGRDRKAIGAFLEQQAQQGKTPTPLSPALAQNVGAAAAGLYRSMGFSAAGTDMLIQSSRASSARRSGRSEAEQAIGRQLSRQEPDRTVLNSLVAKWAEDQARLARLDQTDLIAVARRLTSSDRQRLGRVLRDGASQDLAGSKPMLELVP